jgi:hypothetical protein
MEDIKSTRALQNHDRLREIREDAKRYNHYFAQMRAHVLSRAVPSYILSGSGMEVVYSPEVQNRLEWIKKQEEKEMERFNQQVLDAGFDVWIS